MKNRAWEPIPTPGFFRIRCDTVGSEDFSQRNAAGCITLGVPGAEGAGHRDLRYEISDIRCGIPFGDDFEIIFQAIGFRKHADKLEFVFRRAYVMTPPYAPSNTNLSTC